MDPVRPLKRLLAYQLATCLTGTVLVGLIWDRGLGLSFATGSLIGLVSVVSIAWASWRVLTQKSVARTVGIIISKYAVLLSAVVYLNRADWFDPVTAGLGLASFIFPALGVAIFKSESETSSG